MAMLHHQCRQFSRNEDGKITWTSKTWTDEVEAETEVGSGERDGQHHRPGQGELKMIQTQLWVGDQTLELGEPFCGE